MKSEKNRIDYCSKCNHCKEKKEDAITDQESVFLDKFDFNTILQKNLSVIYYHLFIFI
jgi:hypothetical protein